MKFKTAYLITIILSLLGVIFLFFFKDKMIYLLYGYDLSVMTDYTAESFEAVKETYIARLLGFYLVFGITFSCLILSCIAIYLRIFLRYYLTQISLIGSLLLSLLYFWILIITLFMPRRIF
jgi:hypothetical protein